MLPLNEQCVSRRCDFGCNLSIIYLIEYTPMEHLISVVDAEYARGFNDDEINGVVDEFSQDSPSELELLATALYVYQKAKDVSTVKQGVIKIKGEKYSETRIDEAIERLKKQGILPHSR